MRKKPLQDTDSHLWRAGEVRQTKKTPKVKFIQNKNQVIYDKSFESQYEAIIACIHEWSKRHHLYSYK